MVSHRAEVENAKCEDDRKKIMPRVKPRTFSTTAAQIPPDD